MKNTTQLIAEAKTRIIKNLENYGDGSLVGDSGFIVYLLEQELQSLEKVVREEGRREMSVIFRKAMDEALSETVDDGQSMLIGHQLNASAYSYIVFKKIKKALSPTKEQESSNVNRVEVINYHKELARDYVFWGKEGEVEVELSYQDDGRTLKIFIKPKQGDK